MILNAQPKQISLNGDGQILWQVDVTSPLPGQPVAQIRKGSAVLKPDLDLLDTPLLADQDLNMVKMALTLWLHTHITTTLEVLEGLIKPEGIAAPASDIAAKLYEGLGIIPRSDVESLIPGLDPEARKVLRQRHVRLGPVLIFVPELNKPVAVRLRALLWWVWHDRPLPAPVPKDGAVSVVVDETAIDPVYYRSIGYPVFGSRAIRVDMLDRLISAIYDGAKGGVFKAEHKMAEWMGCPIPDLYKILESMGHRKIDDPAAPVAVVETVPEAAPAAEAAPVPDSALADVAAEAPAVTTTPAPAPAPAPAIKPALASFRLRRGRQGGDQPQRSERTPRPDYKTDKKPERSFGPDKKPRSDKPKFKGKDRDFKKEKREEKTYVFEAKAQSTGDSPFAILQQMKSGLKDH